MLLYITSAAQTADTVTKKAPVKFPSVSNTYRSELPFLSGHYYQIRNAGSIKILVRIGF